eukprot:g5270.t1
MNKLTLRMPSALSSANGKQPDADLLTRFATEGDETAFAKLVDRHGPMVLGLCRRVLADPHDADDAFQATFLVLARKAPGIRNPALLGNWLYGVAYRVASKVRRRRRERTGTPVVESSMPRPENDVALREVETLLVEELQRLPYRHRQLLTMVYFEGLTHQQIADRLNWPAGSVSRRMAKAQNELRLRMERRGVAESLSVFMGLAPGRDANGPVPAPLKEATIDQAGLVKASATNSARWIQRSGAIWLSLTAVLLVGLLVGKGHFALTGDASNHASDGGTTAASTDAGSNIAGADRFDRRRGDRVLFLFSRFSFYRGEVLMKRFRLIPSLSMILTAAVVGHCLPATAESAPPKRICVETDFENGETIDPDNPLVIGDAPARAILFGGQVEIRGVRSAYNTPPHAWLFDQDEIGFIAFESSVRQLTFFATIQQNRGATDPINGEGFMTLLDRYGRIVDLPVLQKSAEDGAKPILHRDGLAVPLIDGHPQTFFSVVPIATVIFHHTATGDSFLAIDDLSYKVRIKRGRGRKHRD